MNRLTMAFVALSVSLATMAAEQNRNINLMTYGVGKYDKADKPAVGGVRAPLVENRTDILC